MCQVHQIVSHMTETTTSLKLREVSAIDTHTFLRFPKNLQHLDLDHQLLWQLDEDRFPAFEKTIIEAWRKTLKALTQLKSLRLAFECGKDHYADGHIHEHSLSSDPLYIDNLLINPRDSADQSYFASLTSLRLVNCYLRVHGLQSIATQHNATLKELELSRATFDPLCCVGSWSEIGGMCHEALPNLIYLRLARLITFLPSKPRLEGEPEREPIPNTWNPGLEGATSYEWIKNGRGWGADLEMIGPRCPWL